MFDIEKRRKELAGIRYENFGGHFIYSAVDDVITQEKFMIEELEKEIKELKEKLSMCEDNFYIDDKGFWQRREL
jgi:Mg2+ and Co2+ transporter CorA